MTTLSRRPTIDEYDTGSYLEPALNRHDVQRISSDGVLHCDGSPAYDHPEFNLAPDLCLDHAFDLARTLGYTGPANHRIAYDNSFTDTDDVMVLREGPSIVAVATYHYGRAYFEPCEPRTAPCVTCGAETLVKSDGYSD